MNDSPVRQWYAASWPPLAWLETLLKLSALIIGIAAGWQTLANPAFKLPSGWNLLGLIVLTLLSLGLLAAIVDRWIEREVSAMIFVVLNNLGHWGMVLALAAASWPQRSLLFFAGLMLLGDLVKVLFIRRHRFTVRDVSSAGLIRLTSGYIAGYAILFMIALLSKS